MKRKTYFMLIPLLLLELGCTNNTPGQQSEESPSGGTLSIEVTEYGQTEAGPANLYTLKNANGIEIELTNYGGIITRLTAPDKNGALADIVLGFDKLEDYQNDHPYFGALIGRYGNRIAKGKFSIDGQEYSLVTNNGVNALHGGPTGFHKRLYEVKRIEREGQVGVELSRTSPDLEEGYPGNLAVTVRYLLNNDNELLIEYEATTDKTTVVNLTNHSYFNLRGAGNGDILGHELTIVADHYNPVDESLIPTGELRPVEGTPFDFRTSTPIGQRVDADDEQIRFGLGYDHNYVLRRNSTGMELAATVFEPTSGRLLEVLTTEPGVQFYCGNFLDGKNIGKGGKPYGHRTGFCLETQHFPDSPNQPDFPSTVLRPGEQYETSTVYRFSTR